MFSTFANMQHNTTPSYKLAWRLRVTGISLGRNFPDTGSWKKRKKWELFVYFSNTKNEFYKFLGSRNLCFNTGMLKKARPKKTGTTHDAMFALTGCQDLFFYLNYKAFLQCCQFQIRRLSKLKSQKVFF